jgi:hypothetical protein
MEKSMVRRNILDAALEHDLEVAGPAFQGSRCGLIVR